MDESVEPVTVLYFAAARERAGTAEERLDLAGLTVREALAAITRQHPDLAAIRHLLRVAVDQAFVSEDVRLRGGAELALLPPVAGGDGVLPPEARVQVRDHTLSVDEALGWVAHPAAGAQVVMIGVVRDHNDGEEVSGLSYEAYRPMAVQVLADIIREAEQQVPGARCSVQHRVGPLAIGERAVVVAASAAHRQEAFEACRRVIERLKEDAPIWKHERRANGRVWVGLGP